MISSLRLKNFKNFADESIRFGPFTVIVGANATGKSNIPDALRFLHGIGRNYTLAEIVGGKIGTGGQQEWEPIRGGASEIIRFGCKSFELELQVQVDKDTMKYFIEVGMDASNPSRLRVIRESLWISDLMIYNTHIDGDSIHNQDRYTQLCIRSPKEEGQNQYGSKIAFSRNKAVASQIYESKQRNILQTYRSPVLLLLESLQRIRFFGLVPTQMRKPAPLGMTMLGDHGENLPTVLMNVCKNERDRSFIAEWICELTPMDVKDFEFLKDLRGLIHLTLRDGDNRRVSADSASDGTLRFLSMLAILFGQSANFTYLFEEINNGIHPSKIQLFLNLIQEQTRSRSTQVITTTYSSESLSMLNDDSFENASIVARVGESSNAIIRPLSELHRIRHLRASQGLGRLLTSGWMEDALTFTEGSIYAARDQDPRAQRDLDYPAIQPDP